MEDKIDGAVTGRLPLPESGGIRPRALPMGRVFDMTDKTIEVLGPASFRRVRLFARAGDGRVKVRARTTVRPPSLAALLHLNRFGCFRLMELAEIGRCRAPVSLPQTHQGGLLGSIGIGISKTSIAIRVSDSHN